MIDQLLSKVKERAVGLPSRQRGQGMVEYGIIIALIAIVVVALIATMGNQLVNVFSNITAQL